MALVILTALYLPAMFITAAAQDDAAKTLRDVEGELEKSKTRTRKLEAEAAALAANIARLRESLVATATRIQTREAQASFTEQRLKKLNTEEAGLRKKFAARRSVLAELLAGLQRLERNPPPALTVHPDDAVQALRGAMLLGTVVPQIRREANALAQNLAVLEAVRNTIAKEQKTLAVKLAELDKERIAIRALLLKKREASQVTAAEAEAEKLRMAKLAQDASSLKELIQRLGPRATVDLGELKAGEDRVAALRAALRRKAAGLRPATPFSQTHGKLNFPAQGIRLIGFGERDTVGGASQGVAIATRAAAQVTTPIDGHVVYAGAFRSYGHLLIINAGEGYHVVLAGMESVNVSVGQFILAGEPVGVMGHTAPQNAVAGGLDSDGKPVLYVEFRRNGTSIDPSPWWAGPDEKARG